MSNLTNVSVEEIAQGLNQSRVLFQSMKNSNQTISLYTPGKYISNFFLDRGQFNEYQDLNDIIEPNFVIDLHNTS
jgi:hypothetical protein